MDIRIVFFLTGRRGVGKTEICRKLIVLCRQADISVGGILSPGDSEGAVQKKEFFAEHIKTGERWLLGSRIAPLQGSRYRSVFFSEQGFRRALNALEADIAEHPMFLVLDEVGPLELEQKQGFFPLLDSLRLGYSGNLLIVVRPELLETLQNYFTGERITIFCATPDNRDVLPKHIADLLFNTRIPR